MSRKQHSAEPYDYASEGYGKQEAVDTEAWKSRQIGNKIRRIGCIVAGSFGGIMLLGSLSLTITELTSYAYSNGLIFAGMSAFLAWGTFKLFSRAGKLQRAFTYKRFLAGWEGCTLKELSTATGYPVEFLKKDLQKLIGKGHMDQAILDGKNEILFASEESYKEYQQQRVRIEEEQARKIKEAEEDADPGFSGRVNLFLKQMKLIEPEIDDPNVQIQVRDIKKVITEIRDWVTDHPGSEDKVKRLANYYIPTTLKLMRTYISVDNNQGPTAQNICRNVAGILDTFYKALVNMQDNLLDDAALDVSVEITTLEQMLQREGLTDEDFPTISVRGEE